MLSLLRYDLPEAELVEQALASPQGRISSHRELAASPFVVGPPLPCGSPAFVGRYEAIHQIQQCLELGQPVQLRAGKATDACTTFEKLAPFALLLDEADALTKPGHQFSADFLDQCRALGQLRRLFFVCAARSDLEARFGAQGLTSRFLNDSRRIWVGQLEPEAREQLLMLAPQLTPAQREFALEQAGGFAIALQWLGDALLSGMSLDAAADQLRLEMDRYFPIWWQACSPGEQRLLRAAVQGIDRTSLTDGERRSVRALVLCGLAEEGSDKFTLPGRVWREFVGEQ